MPFAVDPRYSSLEPFFSSDGNHLFFLADFPDELNGEPADEDVWIVDRSDSGWSAPRNLGAPVNSEGQEYYPSMTRDSVLYFTRAAQGERVHFIYRAKWNGESYSEPEKLPEQVNCGTNRYNAWIAPDESFIVVPAAGVEEGVRGTNYYIVFHNSDDTWQSPLNMGQKINTSGVSGWSFSMSPDGKYCFFMAVRQRSKLPRSLSYDFFKSLEFSTENGTSDIYWMDRSVIDSLQAVAYSGH